MNFQVYAYKFPDGKIYVGLTDDPYTRHIGAGHAKSGPVFDYSKRTGLTPEFLVLAEKLSGVEAGKLETAEIHKNAGLGISLNSQGGGGLGARSRDWQPDALREDAKRYSTRSSWLQGNQYAYKRAKKLGVFEECCQHMSTPPRSATSPFDSVMVARMSLAAKSRNSRLTYAGKKKVTVACGLGQHAQDSCKELSAKLALPWISSLECGASWLKIDLKISEATGPVIVDTGNPDKVVKRLLSCGHEVTLVNLGYDPLTVSKGVANNYNVRLRRARRMITGEEELMKSGVTEVPYESSLEDFVALKTSSVVEALSYVKTSKTPQTCVSLQDSIIRIFDMSKVDYDAEVQVCSREEEPIDDLPPKNEMAATNLTGKNNTVFVVCGPSGCGKSWVCGQLQNICYVRFDGHRGFERRFSALLAATRQEKPIVYDPMKNVGTFISRNSHLFKFRVIVIDESPDVISNRLLSRGGRALRGYVENRVRRFKKIAEKYGEFSGTSNEVLNWMRSHLSST